MAERDTLGSMKTSEPFYPGHSEDDASAWLDGGQCRLTTMDTSAIPKLVGHEHCRLSL